MGFAIFVIANGHARKRTKDPSIRQLFVNCVGGTYPFCATVFPRDDGSLSSL